MNPSIDQCLFCFERGETTLSWGETTLSLGETTLSWGETTLSWSETTFKLERNDSEMGRNDSELGRNDRNSAKALYSYIASRRMIGHAPTAAPPFIVSF